MRVIFVILNVFLITVALTSCGGYDSLGISDNSSKEAKRYEVLRALDRGEYECVISILEGDPTYGGIFTEEEGKLNLAAAYLGKAGYDYVDILNELIDAEESPTKSLIEIFAKKASGKIIANLDKALRLYEEIKPNDCKFAQTFYEKEACFYFGLVSSIQATTGLTLAIGGLIVNNSTDITETIKFWLDGDGTKNCDIDVNQNGVPDNADISACAIEFGTNLNQNNLSQYKVNFYRCINNATAKYLKEVSFTNTNNSTFIYVNITVSAQGNCSGNKNKTKNILMTETEDGIYAPAITDGFCKTNFDSCNEPCSENDQNCDCYPCPIIIDDNVLDMNEVILDSINNVDELVEVIEQSFNEDLGQEDLQDNTEEQSELKEQIQEIKVEICETNPEACLCDGNPCDNNTLETATDIQITNSTIISDYLLTQE